ncbi:MAG: ABC transporter permease [Lachnospiraceae bacterium]|nr:ABC transporter permease [Lachnospiraceae bacterium]
MKTLFYPRLAWDGIRKNKRMVFPYILTCICMISMFYILLFLSTPETAALLPRGGDTAMLILMLGSIVIAVFSLIFLFYTNSFLIRRRAAEFGLYNVLGMNKRNITRIISLETLITSVISIVCGLLAGVILSKLAELGLIRMIGGTVTYAFRVDTKCMAITVIFYLAIFAVIWFASVIRVRRSSAVSLLQSEKAGEKAPKANWLLGLLGAAILGAAYYIAVSIDNPISAIIWFFFAVIMVIIATYLLMIAGSVLLCRILQKNKKYYYDPRHFVSVSSMVYRMKRNGAGLASIAIIATMVLVMISSASCLWFGTRNMLATRFPGDINYTARFYKSKYFTAETIERFRQAAEDFNAQNGAETETVFDIAYIEMEGAAEGNTLDFGDVSFSPSALSRLRSVNLIPLSVYNERTGQSVTLNEGEAIAFASGCALDNDTLDLTCEGRTVSLRLVKSAEKEFYADEYLKQIAPQISLIIPDIRPFAEAFEDDREYGVGVMRYVWKYSFDIKQAGMGRSDYAKGVKEAMVGTTESDDEMLRAFSISTEDRERESVDFIAATGSLFFIGIVLSAVFILAAVLIIYYKQISEGYEDCKRFEVMRKVGMTGKEIRTSINSQLLVVFFIPLAFAGLHLAFAFPMIGKMLNLFGIFNTGLFMVTTLISFVVFAIFYAAVYKVTSNVYYNIVSDAK